MDKTQVAPNEQYAAEPNFVLSSFMDNYVHLEENVQNPLIKWIHERAIALMDPDAVDKSMASEYSPTVMSNILKVIMQYGMFWKLNGKSFKQLTMTDMEQISRMYSEPILRCLDERFYPVELPQDRDLTKEELAQLEYNERWLFFKTAMEVVQHLPRMHLNSNGCIIRRVHIHIGNYTFTLTDSPIIPSLHLNIQHRK